MHTENVLNSVKPVELIQRILQLATSPDANDIVLDFFSGSATTAHAVLQQNLEDGGNRRFVCITIEEPLRLPEPTFDSIFGMGLARVRNVAAEIAKLDPSPNELDCGFRVLKSGTSNLADVHRTPDGVRQEELGLFSDTVKAGRSGEDLLFQVLLDWGLELTLPIRAERVDGHQVFIVDEGVLIACFDNAVKQEVITVIAGWKPLRMVFRDSGFVADTDRINAQQIFAELSPSTDVKVI